MGSVIRLVLPERWSLALLAVLFLFPVVSFAQTVAYTLTCPGVVTTDSTVDPGAPLCTDGSGDVEQWQAVPPFDVSQLDYGQAGEAFAAGFVIVGSCWALGRVVRAFFDVIGRS